jgi:outer membrane protein OmpA-like peptidoglycan-associated protein
MTSADNRIGRHSRTAAPAMALALVCALWALGDGSALAQDTLYIGKDDPSVSVDFSVIEALGPPPRSPELMIPITSEAASYPARPSSAAPAPASTPVTLRSPTAAKPKPAAQAAAKPAPAPAAAPKPAPAAAPPPAPAAAPAPAPKPAAAPKSAPVTPTPEAVASAPAKPATPAPPPPPAAAAPPPPPQAAPKPAPAPAPAPAAAAQPEPKPQVASAPATPAPAASSAETIQLLFGSGEADLTEDAKKTLAGVAQTLRTDDNARLQLMAFAAGAENEASMARRLSLSRALAVRSYLIAEGVRSTRIDVRALGNKTEAEPADRVDLLIDRR